MTKEEILKILKERVTEKRYIHTLGVIEESLFLADIYHLVKSKVEISAALHDICKYDDISYQKENLYHVFGINEVDNLPVGALHAYSGYLEAIKFGFTDKDILDPIKYHTTGKIAMSDYEMVLFIADFSEPNRTFSEAKVAHEIAKTSLVKATYYCLNEIYKMLLEEGKAIAPILFEVLNYYKDKALNE